MSKTKLEEIREALERAREGDDENHEYWPYTAYLFQRVEELEGSFKNFHRNLCKRFGYGHDDHDWQRDLASLEEHIAGKVDELEGELETEQVSRSVEGSDLKKHVQQLQGALKFQANRAAVAEDKIKNLKLIVERSRAEITRCLGALLQMEAGFAGMFGSTGKDPKEEAWEMCQEIIKQALKGGEDE